MACPENFPQFQVEAIRAHKFNGFALKDPFSIQHTIIGEHLGKSDCNLSLCRRGHLYRFQAEGEP
jgi:hypothetical protein